MSKTDHKHKDEEKAEKHPVKEAEKPKAIEDAIQLSAEKQAVAKHCESVGIPADLAAKLIARHFENASILRQLK